MESYKETIRQAVKNLPYGSRRLRAGLTTVIARKYGRTVLKVRKDVAFSAKRRDNRRAN